MESKSRVLVIGLDGVSLDLLLPLLDRHVTPNLERLVKEGAAGELTTVFPPSTPTGWSSLYTGKNPGKHGVFSFVAPSSERGRFNFVNSTMRHAKDVWETIGESGRKVCVVNTPVTYPVRKVNGCLVSGLLTPEGGQYTYPADLKYELEGIVESYRFRRHGVALATKGRRFLMDDMQRMLNHRGAVISHLMRKDDWDFIMAVFGETDEVQHWFLADTPTGSTSTETSIPNEILTVFQRIDEIVGMMLNTVKGEAHVLVVSDHGTSSHTRRFFHTNTFLKKIGLLHHKPALRTRLKLLNLRIGPQPLTLYFTLDSLGLRKAGRWLLRHLMLREWEVDWERTLAYSPGLALPQIYVKQDGGQASQALSSRGKGSVEDYLVEALGKLRDPEGNTPVVEKIFRRGDLYWGPYVEMAPDIQFQTAAGYAAFPFRMRIVTRDVVTEAKLISGGHSMGGLIILHGSGVKKGKIEGASIMDIAPTILYLMGLPVPTDMDGKVLVDGFDRGFLDSRRIMYASPQPEEEKSQYTFARREEKEIEDRLRALGYLG